ncbi:site-specific tyrosine recombinase/integron integrase [Flavisericum labens]|uniref:site-specific tyrosine recombinase/integron integrase n=1 Tax=Flavisericum labens TaxID=3377112 RepID=UPI00387B79EB
MPLKLHITLKHLLIDDTPQIGLKFYANSTLQILVKELNDVKWSEEFTMFYIRNTKANLDAVFKLFKGVAWIDTKYFFEKNRAKELNETFDARWVYERKRQPDHKFCPKTYLQKLKLKKYANNTVKTYVSCFESFINYYREQDINTLDENDIRNYLEFLIQTNRSKSYINQAINSIKFYYETVLGLPNRFYSIERPRKSKKLPTVLSKKEVLSIISHANNLKHKCIISLLYSAGLRRSELLNLKLTDIESNRMLIKVRDAKGNKDRYTILSENALKDLRLYYKSYRPSNYLFEGQNKEQYSANSVGKVVSNTAKKAGVKIPVTAHILRHSFATHLLEAATDIRYIQLLLGHNSTKTTEIYTHVAKNSFSSIKNPLDL